MQATNRTALDPAALAPDATAAPRRRRGGLLLALIGLAALAAGGCTPPNNQRAAVVLIDISREYAHEIEKARLLTNVLLTKLEAGDSLALAFIDNTSYSDRNFIARADFGHRPSVVNEQKRRVRAELDAFLADFEVPSAHSDITGGVLLARDYLARTDAAHKRLYLLSNMQEDLPPRLERGGPLQLDGIEVVAVNVTREARDNIDPEQYRERLARWAQRVEQSGGQWRLVHDVGRLRETLALRR